MRLRRPRLATLRLGSEPLERRDMLAASLSVSDSSLGAGFPESAGQAMFTVALSESLPYRVAVRYTTVDRTATLRDGDYVKAVGTAYIEAGATSVPVTVTVNDDAKYEADETFALQLLSASGATISGSLATCTITNDDPVPVPTVSVGDVRLSEGNHGQKMFNFVVTLSEPTVADVQVAYQTVDGTAQAGYDFSGTAGTLTFRPGTTRRSVSVWVTGDTSVEATENFDLMLLGVPSSNATVGKDAGKGTIVNDDIAAARRSVATAALAMLAADTSVAKPSVRRR